MVQLQIVKLLPARSPVGPLVDGQTFDFDADQFSVEAVPVQGAVKYEFVVDNGPAQKEGVPPFDILGGAPFKPAVGTHTIVVRALNAANQVVDSTTVHVTAPTHGGVFITPTQPIDFDAIQLPATGTAQLKAGFTYVLTRPKQITCRLVPNAPGPRPIIQFDGNGSMPGTGALQTVFNNAGAGTQDIDFRLGPGMVAVAGEGGFDGVNANIIGGGGIFHGTRNSHLMRFTNFVVAQAIGGANGGGYYGGYCGPMQRDQGAGGYTEENSAGVELIDCSILAGVTAHNSDHILRLVGFRQAKVIRGRYIQPTVAGAPVDNYHAMFRAHHGGTLILGDQNATTQTTLFQGLSVTFGPLTGDDGGKNIPADPAHIKKRNFFDTAALQSVRAFNCIFDTTDFRIWPGVLDFEFRNCLIRDRVAGSIIDTPFPYMGRQKSRGTFFNCKFEHISSIPGAPVKLFSDDAGAQDIKCVNCTFAGNVFNKP
jgi:hypothetical protein